MAALGKSIYTSNKYLNNIKWNHVAKLISHQWVRHGGTYYRNKPVQQHGPVKPPASKIPIQPLMYNEEYTGKHVVPEHFRHVFPEFLPDPDSEHRNRWFEKLQRKDMLARRSRMDIPEFYVGSILAVTIADPNATGNVNRFLGICIDRGGAGLHAWFTLRNVVDNLGVEINYEMYCPLISSIEIIRLEKRLDDKLYYLRDALHEYTTYPQDMEPEPLSSSADVPVNNTKVVLKPRPWCERWWQYDLKGLSLPHLPIYFYQRASTAKRPFDEFDLMKEYRETISEEEQGYIYNEMQADMPKLEAARRRIKRFKLGEKQISKK